MPPDEDRKELSKKAYIEEVYLTQVPINNSK